jgi:hypothetical protein
MRQVVALHWMIDGNFIEMSSIFLCKTMNE